MGISRSDHVRSVGLLLSCATVNRSSTFTTCGALQSLHIAYVYSSACIASELTCTMLCLTLPAQYACFLALDLSLQLKSAIRSNDRGGSVPVGPSEWDDDQLNSFLHHAVKAFLRNDLYTALTELLGRAEVR